MPSVTIDSWSRKRYVTTTLRRRVAQVIDGEIHPRGQRKKMQDRMRNGSQYLQRDRLVMTDVVGVVIVVIVVVVVVAEFV